MTTIPRDLTDPLSRDVAAVAQVPVVERILDTVCRLTGLRFSAVARVTDDRWIACAVKDDIALGLAPGGELKIETTICHEIRACGQLVVIDEVDTDPIYAKHHTPSMYGFQSYISVPIRLGDGEIFGTLCALDPKPARVNTPETIETFKLFADLIAMHLDTQLRLARSDAALLNAREATALQEQFVAVLGHDLRNPLGNISMSAALLARSEQTPQNKTIISLMQNSVSRMNNLIENLLDFARNRLGGGMRVSIARDINLAPALVQVIGELQNANPTRTIHRDMTLKETVDCDPDRIAQLLSNLLANALTHGDAQAAITVHASTTPDTFELVVINAGPRIPDEIAAGLFKPFTRHSAGRQGLGLGLYIVSEIAGAHGGTIAVDSTDVQTRFSFTMPRRAQ